MMATGETHRFRVKGFLVLVLLIATCGPTIASGHAPPDEEELATNTVINFAKALSSRSKDRILPYLTGKAKAIVAQWPDVFGISNPHLGSFEILRITRLSDAAFEFIIRQYEEYTGYGIVGYYDITLLVEKIGNTYLISSMQWGDYVEVVSGVLAVSDEIQDIGTIDATRIKHPFYRNGDTVIWRVFPDLQPSDDFPSYLEELSFYAKLQGNKLSILIDGEEAKALRGMIPSLEWEEGMSLSSAFDLKHHCYPYDETKTLIYRILQQVFDELKKEGVIAADSSLRGYPSYQSTFMDTVYIFGYYISASEFDANSQSFHNWPWGNGANECRYFPGAFICEYSDGNVEIRFNFDISKPTHYYIWGAVYNDNGEETEYIYNGLTWLHQVNWSRPHHAVKYGSTDFPYEIRLRLRKTWSTVSIRTWMALAADSVSVAGWLHGDGPTIVDKRTNPDVLVAIKVHKTSLQWPEESIKKFDPKLDGFSFSNGQFSDWAKAKGICHYPSLEEIIQSYQNRPIPFQPTIPFYWFVYLLSKRFHELGHCYGLSAAALDYYIQPEKVPEGKKVKDLSMEEAYGEIEYYQTAWIFDLETVTKGLLLTLGSISLEEEYELVKRSIDGGEPVLIALYGGKSFIYHNVVGYDYEETGDRFCVYIYDPNYPQVERMINLRPDGQLQMAPYSSGGEKFTRFVCLGKGAVDYSIWDNMLGILVHSPVKVHIYDSQGKHVGLTHEGIELGFPAIYLDDDEAVIVLIPSYKDDYKLEIVGTGKGYYHLIIAQTFRGQKISEQWISEEVVPNIVHVYSLNVTEQGTQVKRMQAKAEINWILIGIIASAMISILSWLFWHRFYRKP